MACAGCRQLLADGIAVTMHGGPHAAIHLLIHLACSFSHSFIHSLVLIHEDHMSRRCPGSDGGEGVARHKLRRRRRSCGHVRGHRLGRSELLDVRNDAEVERQQAVEQGLTAVDAPMSVLHQLQGFRSSCRFIQYP